MFVKEALIIIYDSKYDGNLLLSQMFYRKELQWHCKNITL